MQGLERRTYNAAGCRVGIENREDGQPVIVGYGAVFYRKDEPGTEFDFLGMFRERIMPGAFKRALSEKQDVAGLFNHDANEILGRTGSGTMNLSVDKVGLRYEITPPATRASIVESIQRGDIHGSSFAFSIRDESWRTVKDGETKHEIREIRDLDLYDTGPVVFPAYMATTTGIRSLDELAELPETAEIVKSFRRWQQRMNLIQQRGQEVEA